MNIPLSRMKVPIYFVCGFLFIENCYTFTYVPITMVELMISTGEPEFIMGVFTGHNQSEYSGYAF